MDTAAEIISALRGGKLSEARAVLDRHLAAAPENAELLALKSFTLVMEGNEGEAVGLARRAMSHADVPAQKLKYAGNLAVLLAKARRWSDVAALTAEDLPSPAILPAEAFDAQALVNLCGALVDAGEQGFVARFLAPALDHPGSTWELELLWLRAALTAGDAEGMLRRIESPGYRWRARAEASAFACMAADGLGDRAGADGHYQSYLQRARAPVAPRADPRVIPVCVISANPGRGVLGDPAETHHMLSNFPSQLMARKAARYRFLSIFAGSPARALPEALAQHERAITLNNTVNAESLRRGMLSAVEAHEQAIGLPIVNAAAKAVRCTPPETAEMLRGIPNLIVPRIQHFRLAAGLETALRRRIEELFTRPVLLRSVGEQEAKGLVLARTREDIEQFLADQLARGGSDFYAIEFAGHQHPNGMHRRLRAAFVAGEPTLIRADYDDQWLVQGRKFDRIIQHYARDKALLADADGLVTHPERLGAAALATLREVGKRIPLDIFGMDLDVDGEGRVIFFESNATMLLLSNAPPEIAYPVSAEERFLARVDRLFLARAGLSLQ